MKIICLFLLVCICSSQLHAQRISKEDYKFLNKKQDSLKLVGLNIIQGRTVAVALDREARAARDGRCADLELVAIAVIDAHRDHRLAIDCKLQLRVAISSDVVNQNAVGSRVGAYMKLAQGRGGPDPHILGNGNRAYKKEQNSMKY